MNYENLVNARKPEIPKLITKSHINLVEKTPSVANFKLANRAAYDLYNLSAERIDETLYSNASGKQADELLKAMEEVRENSNLKILSEGWLLNDRQLAHTIKNKKIKRELENLYQLIENQTEQVGEKFVEDNKKRFIQKRSELKSLETINEELFVMPAVRASKLKVPSDSYVHLQLLFEALAGVCKVVESALKTEETLYMVTKGYPSDLAEEICGVFGVQIFSFERKLHVATLLPKTVVEMLETPYRESHWQRIPASQKLTTDELEFGCKLLSNGSDPSIIEKTILALGI